MLIRLGQHIVNFDHVTDVSIGAHLVEIHFADNRVGLKLFDDEYEAFMYWANREVANQVDGLKLRRQQAEKSKAICPECKGEGEFFKETHELYDETICVACNGTGYRQPVTT